MCNFVHLPLPCIKITDKGLEAVLQQCHALRSISLLEVEGRLSRSFWNNLTVVPETLEQVNIMYSERTTHHSWVTEHLGSALCTLQLAPRKLKRFSATTLIAPAQYAELNISEGLSNFGCERLGEGVYLKRMFYSPVDEALCPRKLTPEARAHIVDHGSNLRWLEIDMYLATSDDLRNILESCKLLEHLRIHLDAPLQKIVSSVQVQKKNLRAIQSG